ncbi:hypothetical protein NVP1079O_40 [Vibrio phage 1.079.O._10N.286.45.E9]|nr:hypothetical protein NVP1079O_40 [Vibrio phage 1.079.O._10N.286.45.E9]
MSKLVEFKNANLEKLQSNWVKVKDASDYKPKVERKFVGSCGDIGFTHFVASEFCNHNNQSGEYIHV